MAQAAMDISITPDVLFTIADTINITSANVGMLVMTLLIAILSIHIRSTAKIVPTSLQICMEGVYEWFNEKIEKSFTTTKAQQRVLPVIITLFLVILFGNFFSVFPLLHSVIVDGKSLMATPTSHLSMTLALTFIVLGVTHLTALYLRPIKYIGNFIKIGPIVKARSLSQLGQAIFDFVLGLLDIIGEIAKVISLSCRLFGNMLAGELMVVVIAGLSMYTQFFAPIPFLILGLLSAVVQALVFALLSLNYISMAISSVEDEKTA